MLNLKTSKQTDLLLWVLVILIIFIILRILNKFGLFGKTEEEKGREQLEQSATMQDINKSNKLVTDLKKKAKENKQKGVSTEQTVKNQYPNKARYGKFVLDIKYAKGVVNDNEEAVFNVFRSLASQFEVSHFSTVYKQLTGTDLFTYLDSFLSKSELSEINDIVKRKPKVL